MTLSVTSIAVLVVCIVVANLLVVALRMAVELSFTGGVQSAVACGVGALAWLLVAPKLKR